MVIMAVGVPGSGKTHCLKDFAEAVGSVYICPDDIREQLLGNAASQSGNAQVWNSVYLQIKIALKAGRSVVIDATNARFGDRIKLIRRCREFGALRIDGIWFDPPLETCLTRNAMRARVVPDHAVRRMHAQLSERPPLKSDGFDSLSRRID
jgi:predicted kinase